MSKWCRFSFNKLLYLPFIFWLFQFGYLLIYHYMFSSKDLNSFHYIWIRAIILSPTIIFTIILYCQTKSKTESVIKQEKTFAIYLLGSFSLAKKFTCPSLASFGLITLCGVLALVSNYFIFEPSQVMLKFNHLFCIILFIIASLLCRLVLNYKFGKHHIFAYVIFVLCIALTFVLNFLTLVDYFSSATIGILALLFLLVEPLREIIEKILMERFYLDKYLIIFLENIMQLVFASIIMGISEFIPTGKFRFSDEVKFSNFFTSFSLLWNENSGWIVFLSVLLFITEIFRLKTNEKFVPFQRFIFESFTVVALIIINLWTPKSVDIFDYGTFKSEAVNVLFLGIILGLLLVGYLIFMELFILKCCGFGKDAMEEIKDRSMQEALELIEDYENSVLDIETNGSKNNIIYFK